MKVKSYQQFAIVAADTAQTLTDELNRKMIELADKRPVVTFEGLIARISYTMTEEEPENLVEEYEGRGINLTCQDCPFFRPLTKADGSVDRRAKRGGCSFTEYGITNRDSRACEKLFKMLNDGEVRLCLSTE